MSENWELGEAVAYVVGLGPDNIPLMESWIWPDDLVDRTAEWFAGSVEREATRRMGFVSCEGAHSDCAPDENGWHAFTCAYCGAVV